VIRWLVPAVIASILATTGFSGTANAATATSGLLRYNRSTGELSTWRLDGNGHVVGTQTMDWTCSYASGCSSAWKTVGTADLNSDGHQDVTWFNANTGEVSTWLTNGSGTVLGTQPVDWRCDNASGCSKQWRPITLGDVNGDGKQDLLWWNRTSGVVSAWLMNGFGNVLATQDLDWRCNDSSTCATNWRPVGAGDMNNDGKLDLVWFDYQSGIVSTWLLNGYGNVTGKQDLDWHCDIASSCSLYWNPMAVGDVNGDGRQDVLWYDRYLTGVTSTWLLNGYGNVLGKQDLDRQCDLASGCASTWQIVDLVR